MKLIRKILPVRLKKLLIPLYRRHTILQKIPSSIGFEVTTKCNSLCIMCARREMDYIENRDMDFSILSKVVDEMLALGKRNLNFYLTGLSEPLLYGKLPDAVSYVKGKLPYSRVNTITNGIALNDDLSKQLIQNGLDHIMVSLNAGSRETYKWLCGVDRYAQVVDNILKFLAIRDSLNQSSPTVEINLKITDATRNEIAPAIEFWKNRLLPTDSITTLEILRFRDKLAVKELDSQHRESDRYPCFQLWSSIKLDIDGNIYPCCGKVLHPDYRAKSELCLGNIYETSLHEVYAGEKIKHIRNLHLKDKIAELPTCLKCDAYKKDDNVWLENKYFGFIGRRWI